MAEGYLLGVDIGTYSSKGVIVTTEGRIIATHTVPHGIDMPKPGYFEHDADQIWWHDFVIIVQNLLKKSELNPHKILAIGTSAIGSCVLPIDEQGHPLRPGILYGIDTRASDEIHYLEEVLGKEKIFASCAMHLSSQASGPKILWIKNHEPEIYKKTRWFLTSQAYLVFKLTRKPSIDIYTAAGYAPIFDVYKKEWIPEIAALITPIERLPPLYWSGEIVGQVTPEAAHQTGLIAGTPVVPGTTDAAAEALSAGVADFGDMMLMFGSSVFFILKTKELIPTHRFWSSNFLEAGSFAFLGGMSTSGSLTTWFRDQFAQLELKEENETGINAFTSLAEQAAQSPPGANGLVLLPYFEGERTPLHDPSAKGVLLGLSLKHTRKDIYRAILEGVAYGIRHNLEVMKIENVLPQRIIAVGGGTKNPLWLQIVADVCNMPLQVPVEQIGASYGDAFLAGQGIGLFSDLTEIKKWVKVQGIVTPNKENGIKYDFYYELFRDLYKQTAELMHRLSNQLRSK